MRVKRWLMSATLVSSALICGCGGDDSPSTTGTDASDGVDATSGTDGVDATSGTDGVDATSGTDGTDGSTVGEVIDVSNDPIGVGTAHAITGPTRRPGAIAGFGSTLAVCNGSSVSLFSIEDMSTSDDVALSASCEAVGAGSDFVIATSSDGTWVRISDTASLDAPGELCSAGGQWCVTSSTEGPAGVHALLVTDTHVIAAVGPGGIATAPADLSTEAASHAVATDARDVTAVGSWVIVSDGLAGFKQLSIGSDGSVTAGANFAVSENALAFTAVALSDTSFAGGVGGSGLLSIEVAEGSMALAGEIQSSGYLFDLAKLDNLVLAADWDRIRAYDMSDPSSPKLVARQGFTQRAYGVEALMGAFYTIGLDHVTKVVVNPSVMSPELDLPRTLVQTDVPADSAEGSAGILVYNTGRAELVITNIKTSSDRLKLLGVTDPMTLAADDVTFLEVAIEGSASEAMTVSFETNDPDHPTAEVTIDVNPTLLKVGDTAPQFSAPVLAGDVIQLSDFAGQVVHLKLFNSQ